MKRYFEILNRKNANAYSSSGNMLLDYFIHQNIDIKLLKSDKNYIINLLNKLEDTFDENPELFCKCVLYHRNLKTGNGYKLLFYISMLVIRFRNIDIYKEMLVQSLQHGYYKDVLRLFKIINMSNLGNTKFVLPKHLANCSKQKSSKGKKMKIYLSNRPIILDRFDELSNINVDFELQLYSDLVTNSLLNLYHNNDNIDPFLFKYLSNETGSFTVESECIWNYVEHNFQKL